jgi:hypothetical protein
VVAEVSQVVNTLGQCWLNADHRERARRRLTWDEYEVGDWAVLMGMIEGSPVGPEAWTRVEEAAARFEAALSEDLAAVYRLGRLLAGAKNPTSRDYNREAGCDPVYDRRYVLGRLWPEIQSLLRQASVRVPGLATGPARIEADGDPYDDLKPVEDHILTCLRSYTAGEPPRPQEPPPCEPVTEPAPVGLARPLSEVGLLPVRQYESSHADEYKTLLETKERMEKESGVEYIGRSLAVLKVFADIERYNREPDEPLLVIGPSGAGKTRLLEVVHRTSDRRIREYRYTSANESRGQDPGLFKSRWMGVGKKSGLTGLTGSDTTPSLLAECEGGTIAIDEYQNLEQDHQMLLRQILDRMPIPPSAGVGDPIVP